MNSSQSKNELFKKKEFSKLCFILGLKRSEIKTLLESIDKNYNVWSEVKTDKQNRPKTYLDGTVKKRTFRNPSVLLKHVQKRIKINIIDKVELPNNVHGGVKKRSNITNAKAHQGNKYLFETDLQEFYPNINMEVVYQTFLDLGYSTHVSHWLTKLTTKDNQLPQGSPASLGISNLVFMKTDIKLIQFCKSNSITFTRYVDDLTFSAQQNFGDKIQELLNIVINDNFKISRRKTVYDSKQTITGIQPFLNKIDAPEHLIEKSKLEIETNAEKKPYTLYRRNILKTNNKNKNAST
ncbi:reverse transcriptase family protein [Flavobacterium filum]|jgi:RNA-directed DNA polymerase|uniref:reverse transcriptase family protein n=1 Tax=Flavobacterium filum TaxID=370974 RepID=UPI0023F25ADF|nr:reverse transcriptase family protein [Flavobacterium filum]